MTRTSPDRPSACGGRSHGNRIVFALSAFRIRAIIGCHARARRTSVPGPLRRQRPGLNSLAKLHRMSTALRPIVGPSLLLAAVLAFGPGALGSGVLPGAGPVFPDSVHDVVGADVGHALCPQGSAVGHYSPCPHCVATAMLLLGSPKPLSAVSPLNAWPLREPVPQRRFRPPNVHV